MYPGASALALAIASPAFATPTSGDWDTGTGKMDADRVYYGAAVYDKTGVYSGNVTAEAYYTWNTTTVSPGSYWPGSTEWGTVPAEYLAEHPDTTWAQYSQCPANSFCPGSWGAQWHYDGMPQGITSCTTGTGSMESGAYVSDAGSSVVADCYSTTNTGSYVNGCQTPVHVASGATMTGRDYYGWGDDTCDIAIADPNNNGQTINPQNDSACADGYAYVGSVRLSNVLGYTTANASQNGNQIEYTTSVTKDIVTATGDGNGGYTYTTTQTNQTLQLATVTVTGTCSTMPTNVLSNAPDTVNGTTTTKYAAVPSDYGNYCYCQVTSFSPGNGLSEYLSTTSRFDGFIGMSDSPFRLLQEYTADGQTTAESNCSSNCQTACETLMTTNTTTRQNDWDTSLIAGDLLYAMKSHPDCQAKRIDIAWRGATQNAIAANNAGSTWYADNVTTPVEAVDLPGKTFQGWRFLSKSGGVDTSTPVTLQNSDGVTESMDQEHSSYINHGTQSGPTQQYIPYDGPTLNPSNNGNGDD